MFLSMLKKSEDASDDDNVAFSNKMINTFKSTPKIDNNSTSEGAMKNKIKFLAKVSKMQRVLREERENILKIKAMNDNKLPSGMLLEGRAAIQNFLTCKKIDAKNEMIPIDYFS